VNPGSFEARLTDTQFSTLSRFIQEHCGIKMPPGKRTMLETRLRKRLRVLQLATFGEYLEQVFGNRDGGEELIHMVDVVTTNKTDFFRELSHFEFLVREAFPEMLKSSGAGTRRRLNLWSAACSTGEEPYSLAMALSEVGEQVGGIDYFILATDLSTAVLKYAQRATYEEERVRPVPVPLRKKYLLRSRDREASLVRIVPELRQRVQFRRLNLLNDSFGLRERMDIIFCRNVFIYFDRATQSEILHKFCRHLVRGGYIFLGHSESSSGLDVPLVQVAPSVYRWTG